MSIFIDVSILPENFSGFIQVVTLGLVYGYGLFYAANLISDGAELLLLVPALAGLVGSVILPVLGAVPDGMMVLFSGIGENAQEEVSVGVGALCGSTIMLLTVPWFMSILAGRVKIEKDQCIYKGKKKLEVEPVSNFKAWKDSGVKLSGEIKKGAHIMVASMFGYAVIQIPALFHLGTPIAQQAAFLAPWAITSLFFCILGFGLYLYYSYQVTLKASSESGEEGEVTVGHYLNMQREEFIIKAIQAGKVSLVGVMQAEFEYCESFPSQLPKTPGGTFIVSGQQDETMKRLRRIIEPFFDRYDKDKSGFLDMDELGRVFSDMGENIPHKGIIEIFKGFDTDGDGTISSEEFFNGVLQYISNNSYLLKRSNTATVAGGDSGNFMSGFQRLDAEAVAPVAADNEDEETEEEDEIPEDLVDLPADEQQRRIKFRAACLTLVGTAIVLVLSDPMVGVLSEVGKRTGISPFYISFVFAPIASNASEVVAAYAFAAKKTTNSMAISLSQLEGAAIMNNTFGKLQRPQG